MPAESTVDQEGGGSAVEGGEAPGLTGRAQSTPSFAATAEGRFAYHAEGDARGRPPLVLLHGFTGHRDDFVGVMPVLARGRRVIAPDLRGHGDSEPGPGRDGYSLDQLATDLVALLDALGIERVDLLGHSAGGLVALRFALARPDRLRSLALLCTGPGPPGALDPAGFRRAVALAERTGTVGLQRRSEEVARAAASPGLAAWSDPERYFLHQRRRFAAMSPKSYRGVGEAFFEAGSLEARLGSIRAETLVMVGALDDDWLDGSARLAAGIPAARSVVVPGAEHHPHQERPADFLTELAAHLERVEAREGGRA